MKKIRLPSKKFPRSYSSLLKSKNAKKSGANTYALIVFAIRHLENLQIKPWNFFDGQNHEFC